MSTSSEERLAMSSGILVSWFVPKFSSTMCTHVPISGQKCKLCCLKRALNNGTR
jgi:hypothetical protein